VSVWKTENNQIGSRFLEMPISTYKTSSNEIASKNGNMMFFFIHHAPNEGAKSEARATSDDRQYMALVLEAVMSIKSWG
jgi:hypothetical protein